jgi:putative ABC transport system substrate-binding protein
VIAATSEVSALAAKSPTSTIPIVFVVGGDPVGSGMVASLARPGGNLTGIAMSSMIVALNRSRNGTLTHGVGFRL